MHISQYIIHYMNIDLVNTIRSKSTSPLFQVISPPPQVFAGFRTNITVITLFLAR